MTLNPTPKWKQCRDDSLFPEAALRRAQCGCPHYYFIEIYRRRVSIVFDALWLPEPLPETLYRLYDDYARVWVQSARAGKRVNFPKSGILYSYPLRDYVRLTVRKEHARSWIALFRQLSRFAYNAWAEETFEERTTNEREMVIQ